MEISETSPAVGTFKATVLLGNDEFAVIVEITEPLVGVEMERAIEGLAGNQLRRLVKRTSEAMFLEDVKVLSPEEKIVDLLEPPIENPNWLPGVRILAIKRV